jgi:hypothetical protein
MSARAEVDLVVVVGNEGDVLLVAADRKRQGRTTDVRRQRATRSMMPAAPAMPASAS